MVPLLIEHGTERTRILAKPTLPWQATPLEHGLVQHAREYVDRTKFEPAPKSGDTAHEQPHGDGRIRVDHQQESIEIARGPLRLTEKIMRADVSVCAIGDYSTDRHALTGEVKVRAGNDFAIAAAWRVVNGVIAAVIFFVVVKPVNALIARARTEPPADPTTRSCPECLSEIPTAARRCAFCTAEVAAI